MKLTRRATQADIPRLIEIRGAVRENRLSDLSSVTPADYEWFVAQGRVWVADRKGKTLGFSASDPRDGTIWALFVDPAHQGMGLGAALLNLACADLARDGFATARLTTDPGTRAVRLYRRLGWQDHGLDPDGEVTFERALQAVAAP
ncbi:MAG: GNAT family N-acetyltransferase [Paracoccaceae bacterium]